MHLRTGKHEVLPLPLVQFVPPRPKPKYQPSSRSLFPSRTLPLPEAELPFHSSFRGNRPLQAHWPAPLAAPRLKRRMEGATLDALAGLREHQTLPAMILGFAAVQEGGAKVTVGPNQVGGWGIHPRNAQKQVASPWFTGTIRTSQIT